MAEHLDVLVVGAGLSGIAAGYHLQTACPDRTYAILEGRDSIGGTWDLFRYPGIRSDSDMYTLGYTFQPWPGDRALADGPSILAYVRDTARLHGIDQHIRFQHKVVHAAWSSADARWTITCERGGERVQLTCSFLLMCAGYYRYDRGHAPAFAGAERFRGALIHPQFWPEDYDHGGKRIVVIGSGATAVTLVPALAARAAHVTMLQRTPTYIVSRPGVDRAAMWLRARLPPKTAYAATRWKNVLMGKAFYDFCRAFPAQARKLIAAGVKKEVGGAADAKDFQPSYAPWDQRLCLVPDGDLFAAIRSGKADVVTGTVDAFTEDGVRLTSGETLPADAIVTATGLELQFLGGMTVAVDGEAIDPATRWNYKGAMLSGVPNLAVALGYTNASWTLKAELACQYVCRVLNHMAKGGFRRCTPVQDDPTMATEPLLDLQSGYVQRAQALMPRQGDRTPWRMHQSYPRDLIALRHGKVDDGVLSFAR
ncbi:MAG: NAD(P)/FAD-dependent oxidoreductase [Myxococcales bacterium]|nr:NAD(P)/FAD-dependent oxidoreductase [Myxococcales bacterium]MBK7197803.1 NAD(P)/FAD-dependent oxidoreductase [Myxococcales bacterium]MBP6845339.1 NAD(P)/FAD-dependent oxidoreductase [Kofleriaceae bacterium]